MIFMRMLFLALFLAPLSTLSQTTGVVHIGNGVLMKTPGLNVQARFYNERIVRIEKWTPQGSDTKKSLSVIMTEPAMKGVSFQERGSTVLISSGQISVEISRVDGRVCFFRAGSPAGQEKQPALLCENGCAVSTVVYGSDSSYSVRQTYRLSPDEGIYGLGADQHGYMNYRGDTVTLVQTNTNAMTPFLVSTKNYGILWDNYSKTVFRDDGKSDMSLWSDVGDNIDYYFIAGETMDSVIAGYRVLTGIVPMYGRWAYGYWQSKEHYRTQDEVLAIATKYREKRMPIDNIVQDWDYWNGPKNWSGMFFDSTLFPQPAAMTDSLHKMNFHFMISIWPAVGPNTAIYKEMNKYGFLYSPTGWAPFKYYDAYN
ncbi:MAG TPA: TIM-barrel domain-containing protein, partial [Bacteroidota bacterium]|nr:TIM-barrel domain-containing protein [Bacteroidota bacterium]